ncbi:MAG: enolase C-terminal domain-like protein [Pseudomonadota bacterium]
MSADLKLSGVNIRLANVPLNRPVVSRVGAFDRWAFVCVDVETAGGIVGRSYIAPYLAQHAPAVVLCMQQLADPLRGRTIAPVEFFDEGMKRISLLGKSGIALYALAGLDMAFWDAHAKAADLPLARHLGGTLAPVKAYNSSGLWLGPIDRLARETEDLVREGGFSAVKVRLGRSEAYEDRQAVTEVISAAGSDVAVMCDFNQGLGFSEARRRLRLLDDCGLAWFEEPIAYHDFDRYADLTARTGTPIMLGENFHGPHDLTEALTRRACDMVMPDVMRIGGVTGWIRAAAIADAFGVEMSSHLFPEISAHLMRVTPSAHWLEWTDWAHPILKDPFEVRDGDVILPDVPGAGIDWDEAALERYRL